MSAKGRWSVTWYDHGATGARVQKFDTELAVNRWIIKQRVAKRSGTIYVRNKRDELHGKLVLVAGEAV